MLRKIVVLLGGGVLLLALVILVRTALYTSAEQPIAPVSQLEVGAGAIERFAGAVRLPTISAVSDSNQRGRQFAAFQSYLSASFPRVHAQLGKETFNEFALLYTWQGTDPTLKPMLLLSHQDVVPIEPGTESDWVHPPFSGAVTDGYVWGRGAWDDKSTLVASLEAIEMLLAKGITPTRTVMLAFGHDEEIGGNDGAAVMAAALEQRGIEFELVLDEGGVIRAPGVMPGIDVAVAMIAIAEKGYLTLKLTARDAGGHSSIPPSVTAVGRISQAITRLQENPLPAGMNAPVRSMLGALAPYMPYHRRAMVANLWLFEGIVVKGMAGNRGSNAMVRTTTAPTVLRAGVKENVLPQSAEATVNFRIVPGSSSEQVIAAVREIIDDPQVEIRAAGSISSEPSSVSSAETEIYRDLARTIRQVRPEALVAPSLLYGATDSRHYDRLSGQVFRFTPISVGLDDFGRIHGTNERISIADYQNAVRFYYQLITNMALDGDA